MVPEDGHKRARQELRSAVYRGDGAELVRLLGTRRLEDQDLQHIGEGLLTALAQSVAGAGKLAMACRDPLNERQWEGDGDLADELAAALGQGPTRMLRSLPVDLEELAAILEGEPDYRSGRVNLETGEVLHPAVIEYMEETGELDPDDDDPANWLFVENQGSHEGYLDMEAYIGTVEDDHRAELLSVAIEGRGAFRRFKDTLARWPGELDRWFAFAGDRQRGRARAWLAMEGYRPKPRTEPPSKD